MQEDLVYRPLLEKALLELRQMRAELAAAKRQPEPEPIALIGMGCRLPGGIATPAEFWRFLRAGGDAVRPIPADRWPVADYYDADPAAVGKMYVRAGSFLDQVDRFDPGFFGISPREAASMDPQQRLLLEVIWEALEHAGLAADRLQGSQTGVFVGSFADDYSPHRLYSDEYSQIDSYTVLGNLRSLSAGRLAYVLGLHGPVMQLDTACSSSLLAMHLACQSLRSGECDLALAGGVNLILAPEQLIGLCRMGAVSADGRCKTFAAAADGFGRGEACGIVVLKRYADARRDGDPILALLRGSAVNHDGRSNGLTAPNGQAQAALVRQALKNAGVAPADIQYVEAHGTGTILGDPLEVMALAEVLGEKRQTPILLGSVKTNLGHSESAAGVVALMKVVLALQHGEIPPNLHFQQPNPHIPWQQLPLQVVSELTPWPRPADNQPRRAGINSFGMSGTNVHLIIEEAPAEAQVDDPRAGAPAERPLHLLCLSAKEEGALTELIERYHTLLTAQPALSLADLAFTANSGRTHFAHRLALVTESTAHLQQQLAAWLAQRPASAVNNAPPPLRKQPRVAFLFTGQGAQYVGMGRELYASQPTFRRALDRCDAILRPLLGESILAVIYELQITNHEKYSSDETSQNSTSKIHDTCYTQPALFALEYALAQLWLAWGVKPDYVLGHSLGEYVAACIAGIFSLEDGLKLVAARGRLMQALPQTGAMVAVMAEEARVQAIIAPYASSVAIAAVNGPQNVVISGPQLDLDLIVARLRAEGIKCSPLNVSHAFHSPLMEPMLAEFAEIARTVTYRTPQIPLIPNLSGQLLSDPLAPDAPTHWQYWVRHVRQAVRFADSVATLQEQDVAVLLEIGPKPVLLGMTEQIPDKETRGQGEKGLDDQLVRLPSLRPGKADWQQLLESLGKLYESGTAIDWIGFDQDYPRQKLVLPTYPFQRQRYWQDAPKRQPKSVALRPLLDRRLKSPLHGVTIFETSFSQAVLPWLADHQVFGEIISPGACQVAMLVNAAALTWPKRNYQVVDLILAQPLVIPTSTTRTVQLICQPTTSAEGESSQDFQLLSFVDSDTAAASTPITHATGKVQVSDVAPLAWLRLDEVQQRCREALAVEPIYAHLAAQEIVLGPRFRWLERLWQGAGEVLAQVCLPATVRDLGDYQLHPGLLDACFQVAGAMTARENGHQTYLPFSLDQLWVGPMGQGRQWWCHARQVGAQRWEIQLWDEAGQPLVQITGFVMRPARLEDVRKAAWRDWLYQVEWQAQPQFGLDPAYLPAPLEITQHLQKELITTLPEDALRRYATVLAQLQRVSIDVILTTLARAGIHLVAGDRWSTQQFIDQLQVIPTYHRLVVRLLEMLSEAHLLTLRGGQWQVLQTPTISDPRTHLRPLQAAYGDVAGAELTLFARCSEQLGEVLRGIQKPLELLFPNGDSTVVTQLHQASPVAQVMNRLTQQAVTTALQQLPTTRGVRILEIGAGTGSITTRLLPQLAPEQTEYHFTDIGASFLSRAKEKFAAYPFVTYRQLDIEQPPQAQGFAPHHYDLVIAANVLHATQDLPTTLRHVRELLAPGGLFVLLENVRHEAWLDLTFGLTEGWWRFADLRTGHPLLCAEQWQQLLLDNGFAAVCHTPEQRAVTDNGQAALNQAIILAQANTEGGQAPLTTSHANWWLILADQAGMATALAAQFARSGTHSISVHAGNSYQQQSANSFQVRPGMVADYQRLFADLTADQQRGLRGIVHLWSLDTPALAAISNSGQAALEAAAEQSGSAALALVQALLEMQIAPPGLWLVTRDAQAVQPGDGLTGVIHSTLWGMAKVIGLEHPELGCACIDLEGAMPLTEQAATLCAALTTAATSGSQETQVALRQGERYVARLARPTGLALPAAPYRLEVHKRGAMDQLQVRPVERRTPAAGEVEIRVRAAGLNFLDVLDVLGVLPFDRALLGGECAGEIVAVGAGVTRLKLGDRVLAVAAGTFASHVTVNSDLVAVIPARLSFEQAASMPVNFLTAYYALHRVAHITVGDKVLIHAAAGGTGMAAVQIARAAGAEVFATASPSKWSALRKLGVTHLYHSRTLAFADQLMADTAGRGVDIVLNSLTGTGFIEQSLATLAPAGRFLEMAKRDIWQAAEVNAQRADVAYHPIDLTTIVQHDPRQIGAMLAELLPQFATGRLQPAPQTVFPIQAAVTAFRAMQQAKHIGKIVLTLPASQDVRIHEAATYLITGGLGGLGLLTARWLVEQGARHLVLLGRSTPSQAAQRQLAELAELGATVTLAQADVADREQLAAVLAQLDPAYPLRGLVHAAGVLDDGALLQQSWPRFARVLAPKMLGAWHLHTLTQTLLPAGSLDFFVLFSSTASLLGNRGQANHAAANAFLDAFASYRQAQQQPALSINWGPWSEVGAAATLVAKHDQSMAARGQGIITPSQGIAAFAHLLQEKEAQVGVLPIEWPRFLAQPGVASPFLAEFSQHADRHASASPDNRRPDTHVTFRHQLAQAAPTQQRDLLLRHLQSTLARVLGLRSAEQVDSERGLMTLGMDSLMAIELRNHLKQEWQVDLPVSHFLNNGTLADLATLLKTQLDNGHGAPTAAVTNGATQPEPQPNHRPASQTEDEAAPAVDKPASTGHRRIKIAL